MALARVVAFDGVTKDRIEEMRRQMSDGEPPEGLPAKEIIVLHDPEGEKSLVILFFDTEDDYRTGDEVLNALPAGDTPGQRASVTRVPWPVWNHAGPSLGGTRDSAPDPAPASANRPTQQRAATGARRMRLLLASRTSSLHVGFRWSSNALASGPSS